MNLKERIIADMKAAMRDKDSLRLDTIRLLRAAIQRREVDDRVDLDDQGIIQIVQKLVKQSIDAAQQFTRGGRLDLAEKEDSEIIILQSYLPQQLSDAEIQLIIEQAIAATGAQSIRDMGRVMSIVKAQTQGRANMGTVSASVKSLLC